MTSINVGEILRGILANSNSKIIGQNSNKNGEFTRIASKEEAKVALLCDRDFDGSIDSTRISIFDKQGQLSKIYDDNDADGIADVMADVLYSPKEGSVWARDNDMDGNVDNFLIVDADTTNDNGSFVTVFAEDGMSSTMYVDRDFDGVADETRYTIYNEDGSRKEVQDDFDMDGEIDRIGYFFKGQNGEEEAYSLWDRGADGTIDCID